MAFGGDIYAAVNLPDSAIITDFRVWVYDISPTVDVSAFLCRQDLSTMTADIQGMAAVRSNGASGLQEIVSDTLAYTTIDNASYKYFVGASLPGYYGHADRRENTI